MAAGDITYDNIGGTFATPAFASGTVSADADTAINVICGFVPKRIVLHYKDTGAVTNDKRHEWYEPMTSGENFETLMSSGVITLEVDGPTVYGDTTDDVYGASEAADGQGFTIPASIQPTDSDVIYWQAWR